MEDPNAKLYAEHQNILHAIEVFRNYLDENANNAEKLKEAIPIMLQFFREYADQLHHAKEEAELFPKIMDSEHWVAGEITREMADQHTQFRSYAAEIEQAHTVGDFDNCISILKTYTSELVDHIAVEDNELFPMCLQVLTQDEQERLYFIYQDLDREFGSEREETLRTLPERLP